MLTPIWAVALRHIRLWKHDPNSLLFILYWPILDVVTWGFLGKWVATTTTNDTYTTTALLGVILWQFIGRGANTILSTFNEELWTHNITTLFSLPLRIGEWIAGILMFYLLVLAITMATNLVMVSLLYTISIKQIASLLCLFGPPLILSGIWLGFTALPFILVLGKRGIEIAYIIGWFFLPFSGAYYPIDILPQWAQTVSSLLPMTSIFEGMRAHSIYNSDPTPYLIKGYVMGALYAAVAIAFFTYSFTYSKHKGLARLTD